jgi:flagellar biosynthetic protein FliR
MDLASVVRFGVLLVRPGAVLALTPALSGLHVPVYTRVGLTVMLALILAPLVPLPAQSPGLAMIIAREMAIGLALGFAVRALIAGAEFAGHLASHQIGFSYAATIDPLGGARSTIMTSLFGMVATLTFLAIDGHHTLLRALSASYAAMPIGGGDVQPTLVTAVRDTMAMVFTVGVRLAAPLIVVSLIAELALGLISRSAPALNFFSVGYPVRLLLGLLVLGTAVAAIPQVTTSLVDRAFDLAARFASAFR